LRKYSAEIALVACFSAMENSGLVETAPKPHKPSYKPNKQTKTSWRKNPSEKSRFRKMKKLLTPTLAGKKNRRKSSRPPSKIRPQITPMKMKIRARAKKAKRTQSRKSRRTKKQEKTKILAVQSPRAEKL